MMKPTKIILHCSDTKDSGTVSWGAIRTYHTNTIGWKDIGYHFGIELVGSYYEILLGRLLTEPGAHCEGHNADSIGICFVGAFDTEAVPAKQWDKGIKLVRWLMTIFNLTNRDVYGHREFNKQKTCPGTKFNLNTFRVQLIESDIIGIIHPERDI